MITVKNLTKSYGARILFENASFMIARGERIGLVGRNGHGKTTFFKILLGAEHADDGTIEIPRNYSIGQVEQLLSFTQPTAVEEVLHEIPEEHREQWRAEKILSGLGFSEEDMMKSPSLFSGGFQVRINLARMLLSEPDLLLLDEPTNYLDITSVRWLIQFLRGWKKELILITHDRNFMDQVVTHTIAIHRMLFKKIEGTTEKMYQQIAKEEEIYEKTRLNDDKRRKEIELFVTRFKSKANIASRVQSRMKMLEKMERREKLADIATLEFAFNYKPIQAKTLLTAEDLSFGYTQTPLFKELSLSIARGDRICIIGKNGKGKTTLLKVLAGILESQTGSITRHQHLQCGTFEQTNISTLDPARTVEDEIAQSSGAERQLVRNICGAIMFEGDDALKKIQVLSGGERARVMLGKIIIAPANILFLDEPTNHFDMDSCDSLLEALDQYEGALVMVTHNEMFLHALADRLIVFRNDGILMHDGNYASFLEKYGWEGELRPETRSRENRKDIRRLRGELMQEKSRTLNPLQKKIEQTETAITSLEQEKKAIEHSLVTAAQNNEGAKVSSLSVRLHEVKREIEKIFEDLDDMTVRFEGMEADFQKRLAELEELV